MEAGISDGFVVKSKLNNGKVKSGSEFPFIQDLNMYGRGRKLIGSNGT